MTTARVFSNLPAGETTAQAACNVFWTVGVSATLDTTTDFVGTILASASISLNNGVTETGRLLANNQASAAGAVTLINDTIAPPSCGTFVPAIAATPPAAVVVPPRFTG
jgi:Ice-binding-like